MSVKMRKIEQFSTDLTDLINRYLDGDGINYAVVAHVLATVADEYQGCALRDEARVQAR